MDEVVTPKPSWSKVGSRSRRKGAAFERRLVRVTNGVLGCLGWGEWTRTPRSGGWMKASNDPSLRKLRGDITAPDRCPFMLEAKNREAWRP